MKQTPIAKAITLLPQQKAVIDWVINDKGSLELMARAGCGKTFTLMEIVKTVVAHKLGDVVLMAFNKSIADELKAKLERLGCKWPDAEAGTVHSFGFRAWKKSAPNVQINDDKVRSIIDLLKTLTGSQVYHMQKGLLAKYVGLAKQTGFSIPRPGYPKLDDMMAWRALWDHHNLEDDVAQNMSADSEGEIEIMDFESITFAAKQIYSRSLDMCREVIDFNDMILAPLVFKSRFFKKRWVLVDESQDTNASRRALALEMLAPGGRMVIVGDDRQAIYGFTGADSNSMSMMMKELAKIGSVKTLPLNVTMRCPQKVVEVAKFIVPDFTAHEKAPVGVVRNLGDYQDLVSQNLGPEDAIICRNTAPLLKTAFMLLGKGIACQVEGRDIGEALVKMATRWKAKDLSAYLDKLDQYQEKEVKKYMDKNKEAMADRLVDQLDCLRVIVNQCMAEKLYSVQDLVDKIGKMFGDRDNRRPTLMLSTIHKSKGREWKRVFALGRNEYLPSPFAKQPWQQNQEKNLEYVLITRAMEELIDVPAPPKEDKTKVDVKAPPVAKAAAKKTTEKATKS